MNWSGSLIPVLIGSPGERAMKSDFFMKINIIVPFLVAGMLLAAPVVEAQQGICYVTNFLTVSEFDDVVRTVNPDTLEVVAEISLSIPGAIEIDGIRGITIHPTTGNWFLLAMTSQPPSPAPAPWLMEYDPINDTINPLGFTVLDFNDIDFREDGDLRAITNILSTGSSNYCELSTITGGPSDLCSYTGSEGGDTIALGSGDEVFRASGGYSVGVPAVFERPSPSGTNNCDSASIAIGANLASEPVRSLTYWPAEDVFLWVQGDTARSVYLVTEDGGDTFLGTFDHDVNGIALVEIATPCPPGDNFIRGDCNLDLGVNVADAVYLLGSLFIPGSPQVMCADAGDCNDDGGMNVADAVYLLGSLFIPGSPTIPEPNIVNGCGPDPTDTDPLDCSQSGC